MSQLEQIYDAHVNNKSDINEHLYILKAAAEDCKHVTEFGVRAVVSTWAFLAGHPEKLICYDISRHPNIEKAIEIAKEENIDFEFILADTRKIEIEPTDVLFIDTLHTYKQLKSELDIHHSKVKRFLILHDTVTFSNKDMEDVYSLDNEFYTDPDTTKVGLALAIEEFLAEHPEWKAHAEFRNNNGLLVLKRSK